MGRPRIEWDDAQLRAIMDALAALNRDVPQDNARFLDGLIAAVRVITGRVYGAMTYGRLLRDLAPRVSVVRRPSTSTIQTAVLRAQALEHGAVKAAAEAGALVPVAARCAVIAGAVGVPSAAVPKRTKQRDACPVLVDADALRSALAPLMHDILREGVASVPGPVARHGVLSKGGRAAGHHLQLATMTLEDAHARVRQLEKEMGELRRELGAAQAARDLAGTHVNAMLADLHETIAMSGRDVASLARAAGRLARTEKFLKAQNDSVRLQVFAEAEALRTQNQQLRERVDRLELDNDRYRRVLENRAHHNPDVPPKRHR
ncbi:hypothetical protein SAMN04487926_1559 [Paraburkholderia steynii]|uniref:Uncharacterized protein n=1 Tax=Paraburkholderia steynii TaxID=1245441 RepID=A0A7Z7BL09_9BURK|nr:hypothetical protein [Paraburkholderia steynii]SDJ49024.1 hypothetical protein SAMN04487926_1559 [Paraburkholderia steynii]